MLIAIDHGNSEIKTVNEAFPSGFARNLKAPEIASDWLTFGDESFALTGKHLPYRRDKTQSDEFFILTLFAIAKELEHAQGSPKNVSDLELAVGLPPAHMQELKEKFRHYLMNDNKEIKFCYNGKNYSVKIVNVHVFPQGFPAVHENIKVIAEQEKTYIVDIGGYTTDVLMLRHGKIDLNCCYSLEAGTIKLFGLTIARVASDIGGIIDETNIKDVLSAKETLIDQNVCDKIKEIAEGYTSELLQSLQATEVDVVHTPTYIVGGGAVLLKDALEKIGNLKSVVYIEDSRENAKGYEEMAQSIIKNGRE